MAEYKRFLIDGNIVYTSVEMRNGREVVHAVQFSPQNMDKVLVDVGGFVVTETILELIRDGKYASRFGTRNETMAYFLSEQGFQEMSDGYAYKFYECDTNEGVALLGKLSRYYGFDI